MSDINRILFLTRDADEDLFKVWDEAIQCKDGTWHRADMLFTRSELLFIGIPEKVLDVAVNECVYIDFNIDFPFHET